MGLIVNCSTCKNDFDFCDVKEDYTLEDVVTPEHFAHVARLKRECEGCGTLHEIKMVENPVLEHDRTMVERVQSRMKHEFLTDAEIRKFYSTDDWDEKNKIRVASMERSR